MSPINLHPAAHDWAVRQVRRAFRRLLVCALIASAAALALGLLGEALGARQQARLAQLHQERAAVLERSAQADRQAREAEAVAVRHASLATLEGLHSRAARLLPELARAAPPGLRLTSVRAEEDKLTITGNAGSPHDLSLFLERLRMGPQRMRRLEIRELRGLQMGMQSASDEPDGLGWPQWQGASGLAFTISGHMGLAGP